MRKIYSITLEIHETMKKELATVLDSLASCGKNKDVCRGFKLHAYLLKNGALIAGSFVADSLAIMYAKCGAQTKAHDLICEFSIDSVMPWTALIAGYIQMGEALKALACYENFQCKGFNPDSIMLTCVAKACGSIGALDKGREIHEKVAKEGLFRNDTVLGTALIDMYAKCGVLVQARQVLDEIQVRDVITWSALIAGFVHHGQGHDAIVCFEEMRSEGVIPNVVTITCILKACSAVKDIHRGVQTHCHITRQGWICKDVLLGNALVEMYAKCSNLVKAQQVLEELPVRNIVSWSALITGYLEVGQAAEALRYSRLMQCDGLLPDALTFACMLKACGMIGAVDYGEQLHHEISRQGLLKCNLLLSTVLMDMYIKCGALHKAHEVINELPLRDTISWNVLLAGYAQLGLGEDALKCFHQMQREGVSLDAVTFTCILKACSSIGAVNKGQEIHHEIARHGFLEENLALKSALVDMYTKFGELSKAQRVLEDLPTVDSVTWSALIAGHALQGNGNEALSCFEQMQDKGVVPDSVTFSCVLNACCHAGLMEVGENFFSQMSTRYGINPTLEHYVCLLTLLGQAGHLNRAVEVIKNLSISEYPALCSILLSACRKWGDISIGKWAFEYAIQLDEYDSAPYVFMANIYADAGMQDHAQEVQAMAARHSLHYNGRLIDECKS